MDVRDALEAYVHSPFAEYPDGRIERMWPDPEFEAKARELLEDR